MAIYTESLNQYQLWQFTLCCDTLWREAPLDPCWIRCRGMLVTPAGPSQRGCNVSRLLFYNLVIVFQEASG